MQPRYQSIEVMLELIPEPNRSACVQMLEENRELFELTPGSVHNHQAWPGGYFDHVQEAMNIVMLQYAMLSLARSLPFTVGDALLVIFLHDIEKPWRIKVALDGTISEAADLMTKGDHHAFRLTKLKQYDIVLTPEQANALKYVEGELQDYSPQERVAGPLAAFCHSADVISARIWFNHPLATADPWNGASRVRNA